ncbi:MAG: hypothetical protein ABIS92_13735 [Polyangia bacterium]
MNTFLIADLRRSAAGLLAAGVVALCFLAPSSLVGCSKPAPPPPPPAAPAPPPPPAPPPAAAPVAVAGVSLGKSIGPDKKITAQSETMGVKDTIYASVETTGVGKATVLKAKWTFSDKKGNAVPVHEDVQTLDLGGPATHEFHISKKTPWPKGTYNVEVLLNDVPAAKKGFSVN